MTTPAPEPVEVAADELAAAERYLRENVASLSYSTTSRSVHMLLREYDRMRAELTSLHRQADASERAANGFYAHAAAMELQRDQARADLARALPVVEAAGAYIDECESPAPDLTYRVRLRAALATAVTAARAVRTGEGT